jgi:hypothetical protein
MNVQMTKIQLLLYFSILKFVNDQSVIVKLMWERSQVRDVYLPEDLVTSNIKEHGRMYTRLKAHEKLIVKSDQSCIKKCSICKIYEFFGKIWKKVKLKRT